MKARRIAVLVALVGVFAIAASAMAFDPSGTYTGTVELKQSIIALDQEVNKSGTVEIVITKKSDTKYDVLIKTKIADLPDTDDKNEYTVEGETLKLHQETNVSGILVETNGNFSLSGSTLTGAVATVAKTTSDGTVQTSSATTYSATK